MPDLIGFGSNDEELGSRSEPTHHLNSPPLDSTNRHRSQEEVKGLKGLHLPLLKEKNENINFKNKGIKAIHNTHHTHHQEILNLGTYHSVDDIVI